MRNALQASLIGILSLAILWGQSRWGDLRAMFRWSANTHASVRVYRSLDEWRARRAELRSQIMSAAGLQPMLPKTPLQPRRFGRIDKGPFLVEKVLLETLPGYYLGGNLYLPKTAGRAPAILVPHGHWSRGRVHDAKEYSVPALCANLATQGYVTFAYDMVGYNDSRQTPHKFGKTEMEQAWGFSPLGLQLWNSIRVVDFLASMEEVDARRIAVTGASGGATQAILLAAVDDRIQASVPVCMVSASFQGDCVCEQAPGLRRGTSNLEITAMMAPKPVLLVSSKKDWTKHTPEEEYPAIQSIYRLYSQPDALASVQIDAGHNYNRESREMVYQFLHRVLRPDTPAEAAHEAVTVHLRPEELLIGVLPPELKADSESEVFAAWRALARRRMRELSDEEAQEVLASTVGASWPRRVEAIPAGEYMLLERRGSGERIPVQWVPGTGRDAAVVVDPAGAEAGRRSRTGVQLVGLGDSVMYVDVYETGSAQTGARACGGDCLTFQRSDDANRVSDILVTMSYMNATHSGKVTLACSGRAGSWCAIAAALTPSDVPMALQVSERPGSALDDTPGLVFIPGLQRAGGMELALRLIRRNHELRFEIGD